MNIVQAMRIAKLAYPVQADEDLIAARDVLHEEAFECSDRTRQAINAAYSLIVAQLEERHLPAYRENVDAGNPKQHANFTDPWSFETYSELYKDDTGSRPRHFITGPAVRAWLHCKSIEQFFDKLRDHAEDMSEGHN